MSAFYQKTIHVCCSDNGMAANSMSLIVTTILRTEILEINPDTGEIFPRINRQV